jgi:hypothetical protein
MAAISIRYERPVSRAAHWARRLTLFALLVALLAIALHWSDRLETPVFLAILAASVGVAALGLVCALIGLASLWRTGASGGRASFWGLLLSLTLLVPALWSAYLYQTRPPLYDVTTDFDALPDFLDPPQTDQMWMARAPVRTADRLTQAAAYPQLAGRRYEGAIDRVLAAVRIVAANQRIAFTLSDGDDLPGDDVTMPAMPDITVEDRDAEAPAAEPFDPASAPLPVARPLSDGELAALPRPSVVTLQGVARSLILSLPSDIVIRLVEEEETTMVDMRAVARYGHHDLGAEAAIVDGFLRALDTELAGASAGL